MVLYDWALSAKVVVPSQYSSAILSLSSIYTHFNTLKEKALGKHCGKEVKLLILSNFTFSHTVFYVICVLKSFHSHISVVVCSFFAFGPVSKWCIREWVKLKLKKCGTCVHQSYSKHICSFILQDFLNLKITVLIG